MVIRGRDKKAQQEWQRPAPYWLDDSEPGEHVRGRCACCSDTNPGVTVGWLLDVIKSGQKRIMLPRTIRSS
ncbi:hypothetical protein ACFPM0_18915 [Pseudonocardia sulfidoxydans]